jgi:hypothetical protein
MLFSFGISCFSFVFERISHLSDLQKILVAKNRYFNPYVTGPANTIKRSLQAFFSLSDLSDLSYLSYFSYLSYLSYLSLSYLSYL